MRSCSSSAKVCKLIKLRFKFAYSNEHWRAYWCRYNIIQRSIHQCKIRNMISCQIWIERGDNAIKWLAFAKNKNKNKFMWACCLLKCECDKFLFSQSYFITSNYPALFGYIGYHKVLKRDWWMIDVNLKLNVNVTPTLNIISTCTWNINIWC